MKKIFLAGLSVLLLLNVFACSKAVEETKYKLESDPLTVEYTFKHKGDEIQGIKYVQQVKFSDQGISKDVMEKQVELVKEKYAVPGIAYKADITDTELKEIIDVDITIADNKKLQELGLMQSNNPDAKFMSLKMTTTALEALGGKKIE